MAMSYKRNVAHFADTVGVEEAEAFLAWLHEHPNPKRGCRSPSGRTMRRSWPG